MKERLRLSIAMLLLTATATACRFPENQPVEDANYSPLVAKMVATAETVVVADVVADGSNGDVVIRPSLFLRGELPLGADGLYHFPWHVIDAPASGVWLFGPDGRPWWGDAFADETGKAWPDDRHIPQYPWDPSLPANRAAMREMLREFPIEMSAEAERLIREARLVVEVLPVGQHEPDDLVRALPWKVLQVLKGDGSVAVGSVIDITQPRSGLGGTPMVMALVRVGDSWMLLDSWIASEWMCSDPLLEVVLDQFVGFTPSTISVGPATAC